MNLETQPIDSARDPGHAAFAQALKVSFRWLRAALLLLFASYLLSGIHTVGQHERAFVLTFGRLEAGPDRIKGPGIHFALPRPFAEVVKVPFDRTQTVETDAFWNRPPTAAETALGQWRVENRPFAYAMTGDRNLVHCRWALRYTLQDAQRVAFDLTDLISLLRHELEHAVVKTAARTSVEALLRSDLEGFRGAVEQELRDRVLALALGIRVQRVDLLDQSPALQVVEAFDAVIQAEQERSRTISQARAAANRSAAEAEGEAARLLSEARAHKEQFLSELKADADTFTLMQTQYAADADVLTTALLQDTLLRTLSQVEEKFVLQPDAEGRNQLRLMLSPSPAEPPPPPR